MRANYTFWFRKSTRGAEQEYERQKKQVKAKENVVLFNFYKGGQSLDQIAQKNSFLDDIYSQLYWKKVWVP